ncbi:hypothetical protein Dd1591_4013 [Dickeya chrysanthemi Ech1591]|uniref:Uncharacterized protein n=1 Tax=Dickeya chrysanthemi (strain Ech1591) TaxID=561229 RepID=C6CP70_DICC1|nr:hypothetical protein Dd1591_4013 [Dickeya chrysanthemi Ech1591]
MTDNPVIVQAIRPVLSLLTSLYVVVFHGDFVSLDYPPQKQQEKIKKRPHSDVTLNYRVHMGVPVEKAH